MPEERPKNVVWIRSDQTTEDGKSMWYSRPRTEENLKLMEEKRKPCPRS